MVRLLEKPKKKKSFFLRLAFIVVFIYVAVVFVNQQITIAQKKQEYQQLSAQLAEQIDKLTRDHQRAKNPEQRNEIFTKLHKAKNQLEELRKLEA